MKIDLPVSLSALAEKLPSPLYAVGGYVRNFVKFGYCSGDIDLASATDTEEFIAAAENLGFKVVAEYKRTGTAVISDGKRKYEYTRFRTDVYGKGGGHAPERTVFTDDVALDALRRDFKCNAVYYDIAGEKTLDPAGGLKDIENGVIDTVLSPEKVFCSDGLRLMRFARFAAELGFTPAARATFGAKEYRFNVADIAPERIFAELKRILCADKAYPFSPEDGHYRGFKLMEETGVLDVLFPEITAGRGMSQRADFHKYDVLEHSLKTLLYAEKSVRLAAFLHDVGKPACRSLCGSYKGHAEKGAEITLEILKRLKADKKTADETVFLVKNHMLDLDLSETETAVRVFIVKNFKSVFRLLELKQADYSAGKDDFSVCPTCAKWQSIYEKMKTDGTPFSLKELKISAERLIEIGFRGKAVGEELSALWAAAIKNPALNEETALTEIAERDFKSILNLLDKRN